MKAKNYIYITDLITTRAVVEFINELEELEKKFKSIVVVINSQGGCIDSSEAIAWAINKSKSKIITIVDTKCKSAAVLIFLQGKERFVKVNSTIMLHPSALCIDYLKEKFPKGIPYNNIKEIYKIMSKSRSKLILDLKNKTHLSDKIIECACTNKEINFCCQEIIENKLASKIIDSIYDF